MEKINKDKFEGLVRGLEDLAENIREAKGKDYSEEDDRLANFRRVAARLGDHPRKAWAFGFLKQVDAVMTWVRTGELTSEPLESRFADIINYCHLGWAIEKACEGTEEELKKERPHRVDLLLCSKCGQHYDYPGQDPYCPHKEIPLQSCPVCERPLDKITGCEFHGIPGRDYPHGN